MGCLAGRPEREWMATLVSKKRTTRIADRIREELSEILFNR
jgi:hypothetical protein